MSSRKENDDLWLAYVSRTADRGPRLVLHQGRIRGHARMTPGPSPGGERVQTQQDQLNQPSPVDKPEASRQQQPEQPPTQEPIRQSDGWQILSYMLGGMILYGGIGWVVSHFTGIAILFPLGMILGIGLSVAMIIFRFTRT
jgi:F0F1-type ATP synthase assembly protein I